MKNLTILIAISLIIAILFGTTVTLAYTTQTPEQNGQQYTTLGDGDEGDIGDEPIPPQIITVIDIIYDIINSLLG